MCVCVCVRVCVCVCVYVSVSVSVPFTNARTLPSVFWRNFDQVTASWTRWPKRSMPSCFLQSRRQPPRLQVTPCCRRTGSSTHTLCGKGRTVGVGFSVRNSHRVESQSRCCCCWHVTAKTAFDSSVFVHAALGVCAAEAVVLVGDGRW